VKRLKEQEDLRMSMIQCSSYLLGNHQVILLHHPPLHTVMEMMEIVTRTNMGLMIQGTLINLGMDNKELQTTTKELLTHIRLASTTIKIIIRYTAFQGTQTKAEVVVPATDQVVVQTMDQIVIQQMVIQIMHQQATRISDQAQDGNKTPSLQVEMRTAH
jgi:hypothetical protein